MPFLFDFDIPAAAASSSSSSSSSASPSNPLANFNGERRNSKVKPSFHEAQVPADLQSQTENPTHSLTINTAATAAAIASLSIMGGGNSSRRTNNGSSSSSSNSNSTSSSPSVAQALEIARDSAEGARDPVVSHILETALARIWNRVQAAPNSYIMSRDEFAVFNYFQSRFVGNDVASQARKRFWDQRR